MIPNNFAHIAILCLNIFFILLLLLPLCNNIFPHISGHCGSIKSSVYLQTNSRKGIQIGGRGRLGEGGGGVEGEGQGKEGEVEAVRGSGQRGSGEVAGGRGGEGEEGAIPNGGTAGLEQENSCGITYW